MSSIDLQILENVFNQAVDGVVLMKGSTKEIIYINPSAQDMFGYSFDEVVGENVKILVPMSHRNQHDSYVERNMDTNENRIVGRSRELLVNDREGNEFWINLSISKVEINGETVYTAFIKDIDMEVRLRQETQDSLMRLKTVLEGTDTGIWEFDFKNQEITLSTSYKKLRGIVVDSPVVKKYSEWIMDIHREDLPRFIEELKKNIDGFKQVFEIDMRIRNQADKWFWSRHRGKLMKDELGFPKRMVSTMVDITKEKLNEENVQKLSLVASRSNNAVVITDPQGRIEWINDAFEEITGYSYVEVIGRKPGSFLQGEDTDPETVKFISERLRNQQGFKTDIVNY